MYVVRRLLARLFLKHSPPASAFGAARSSQENEKEKNDQKIELLTKAYDEVLDATKHQDDKIGRLLTIVAFLTAGTLALSALGGGSLIARRYGLGPFNPPLGLIALVLFLMGVFLTVVLLIMALSHPLRIPGLAERRSYSDPPQSRAAQVSGASQIYFYSISNLTRPEWRSKWELDLLQLQRIRIKNLIDETHNLSGRTQFKYERSREAVSVFTLTLLFFALASAFQTFSAMAPAADNGPQPLIELVWYHKLVIATIVSSYLTLAIAGPNRASRQSFEERVADPNDRNSRLAQRIFAERTFAVALPLATLNLLIFRPFWYPLLAWCLAAVLLSAVSLLAFYRASTPDAGFSRRRRDWANISIVSLTIIGLTVCTLFAGVKSAYWVLVVTVALVPTIICIASTVQPIIQSWRQGQRYLAHRRSFHKL